MYFLRSIVKFPAIYTSFSGGVYIPTKKDMPPPQGEKHASRLMTDPKPVSPPKGDLRSSAATESTGSGGTCRPLGVEGLWDGGMVFGSRPFW